MNICIKQFGFDTLKELSSNDKSKLFNKFNEHNLYVSSLILTNKYAYSIMYLYKNKDIINDNDDYYTDFLKYNIWVFDNSLKEPFEHQYNEYLRLFKCIIKASYRDNKIYKLYFIYNNYLPIEFSNIENKLNLYEDIPMYDNLSYIDKYNWNIIKKTMEIINLIVNKQFDVSLYNLLIDTPTEIIDLILSIYTNDVNPNNTLKSYCSILYDSTLWNELAVFIKNTNIKVNKLNLLKDNAMNDNNCAFRYLILNPSIDNINLYIKLKNTIELVDRKYKTNKDITINEFISNMNYYCSVEKTKNEKNINK